ncbi:MAG: hypothetical protein KAK00_09395 [Nanoarchaeota archaeon]|nr:hypothetical protein [Nanoarchaeota archaeon]
MIKKYLLGIVVVLMGLMIYGLIEGTITGNLVKEEEEKVVIYFPMYADFPNTEQGAVGFDFSFPDASFKVGNKTAEILMFLNSETISGLKIGYNTKEEKIYGGLPLMSSEPVSVINGQKHVLTYTFSRELKKQAIRLDGNLLVEGEFSGEITENAFTGYSVYQKWTMVESPIGMDVWVEEIYKGRNR